jgi:hypothetical protein
VHLVATARTAASSILDHSASPLRVEAVAHLGLMLERPTVVMAVVVLIQAQAAAAQMLRALMVIPELLLLGQEALD